MDHLAINGVLVPNYNWKELCISIRDKKIKLSETQEEMAVAWVRKLTTKYVLDKVFEKNFFKDFSKAMGASESLEPKHVDFSNVIKNVEKTKNEKQNLSKEERRKLREKNKSKRKANKEKFGFAVVDGIRTEVANFVVEPSCIFMGRGKHPMRGRWKEGPRQEDIELNLSPDSSIPIGNWKKVIWEPEVMWIARWRDKLSGRIKHVWLAENSIVKQKRDISKFEKAKVLKKNIRRIKNHIINNLDHPELKRKKTATVCYLIDRLKIRIGDEKDPDEADTIGASTLRPEHLHFKEDGYVTFSFLGKDSIPHIFEVRLHDKVVQNLKEFSAKTKSTLFTGVDSGKVSDFLDETVNGLSAKVFRTYYASEAVEKKLSTTPVKVKEQDYIKKYVATLANLEAAKTCNHKRAIPKTWQSSLQRSEFRLEKRRQKARKTLTRIRQRAQANTKRNNVLLKKKEEDLNSLIHSLKEYNNHLELRRKNGKSILSLQRRIKSKKKAISKKKESIKRFKDRQAKQRKKYKEILKKKKQRNKTAIEKIRFQIMSKKQTRDYNLGTSLKSYIDPRIYYTWGRKVDYDWKNYYPKALRKKFSWIEINASR